MHLYFLFIFIHIYMYSEARVVNHSISLAACRFSPPCPPSPRYFHVAGTKWDERCSESTRKLCVSRKVKGDFIV